MEKLKKREKELLWATIEDSERIMSPYACRNVNAVREYASSKYDNDVLRTQFGIDIDKILHSVLYNRGNDKTQVFSFYRNDDISRRSSHVQLVSRIARVIGRALRLNLELIEAIAIGHDVGHTPFGHKGEEFLSELYFEHTGRYFNHNVHSVRVLQKITGCNLTLQTLDGILCHCGEKASEKYEPASVSTFAEHNLMVEGCYTQEKYIDNLRPSTLEGCVVRVSDMIAYLGKDRQDARKVKLPFNARDTILGGTNAEIITSVVTDLVVNSIDKSYISLSSDVLKCLRSIYKENGKQIYQCEEVIEPYYAIIKPMMRHMYERFLDELQSEDHRSLIYLHYLNNKIIGRFYCKDIMGERVVQTDRHDLNDIVTDFIASMTDDYFIDAFSYLFPNNELVKKVKYIEYFDERYMK